MSFSRKLLSFTGLCVIGISVASAQEVPRSIVDCSALSKDSSRLACFDREVADLTQASKGVAPKQVTPAPTAFTAPSVATTPRPSASSKEDEFGVSGALARKRAESQPESEAPPLELHGKVTSVKTKPYGEFIMELDNGQVWEQPEKKMAFLIKEGEGIVIRQRKLGSYFLTTDAGAVTRVRRVR